MAAKNRATPSLRWRQFKNVLESGWIFRWPTLALYALIGVPFASNSEYPRLVHPSFIAAVGVASLAVSLTVLFIMFLGFLRRFSTRQPAALVILALIGVGATRGWVTTLVVDAMELNRESFGATRVLISAGAVPTLVVVSAFIVSVIAVGRRERRATKRAIDALKQERDDILADITYGDELLIAESEGTLRPQVNAILEKLNAPGSMARTTLSSALENLITTVVRPLSHSLAASARVHHASTESITIPTVSPVFPTADSFVGPLVTAAAVYLTTVVIYFDVVPLVDGLASALIGGAITWTILRSFQALMSGLTLSIRLILTIVLFAHLGTALLVSWVDVSLFHAHGIGLEITIALSAASLVPGLLYVAQRLMAHLGAVRLVELGNTRRDMSLQASEVRRRAWLRQRHIAHALHSAIQSRVNAEAQLVRKGTGPLTAEDVERVSATLNEIFVVLRNTDGAPTDALGELKRAIEFWEGMCTIDFAVDDTVEELLRSDPDVGEAVLVTCLEIINNAIRHGKATRLCLTISRVSFDMLKVVGVNNGAPVGDFHPGLGMSMFDELTVQWSIATVESDTTFTAYIAARNSEGAELNSGRA